jgi:predicted nucleic-acid-binding Zn-ribbon protein
MNFFYYSKFFHVGNKKIAVHVEKKSMTYKTHIRQFMLISCNCSGYASPYRRQK